MFIKYMLLGFELSRQDMNLFPLPLDLYFSFVYLGMLLLSWIDRYYISYIFLFQSKIDAVTHAT